MNQHNKILWLFVIILISHSLVTAQISSNISSGCAPLSVNFTPPPGYTTYYWDFGDGSSSTDANPSNTFINPKEPFVVSFRECKTCPVVATYDITVKSKPSITIPKVNGCEPLDAEIIPNYILPDGITTTGINYIFGDGVSTSNNTGSASHQYSKGSYPVTIELSTAPSDANCDNTVTISDAVIASSINAFISPNPGHGCSVPFDFSFSPIVNSDFPIASYSWDFGDGNSSTSQNPSNSYSDYDTYSVSLTLEDENKCTKTFSRTIEVLENDLKKITAVDTVCISKPLRPNPFNATHDGKAELTSRWSFPGASSTTSLIGRDIKAYYYTEGLYTYSITTKIKNKCPKTLNKSVYVIDPKLLIEITPSPLCNRRNTFKVKLTNSKIFDSVTWSINSGAVTDILSTKFDENVTYTLRDLDSIEWFYNYNKNFVTNFKHIQIVGISKYGCIVVKDTPIINPLIAHVEPTITEGCSPLKVGFIDRTTRYREDTIVEWKLLYGDGTSHTTSSFPDTIWHTYSQRGKYDMKMIVKNIHGCLDTTYVTKIKVGTPHLADFTINSSSPLCASDPTSSVTLTSLVSSDSVDMTKFWADGFQCYNQNTVTYNPKKTAGNIPIRMEVIDNGCLSTVTKNLIVEGPIAKFQYTQNCDSHKSVIFNSTSQLATRYLWDFDGLGISTDSIDTFSFPADGLYTVTLTAFNDNNTCDSSVYTLDVKIQTPIAKLSEDTFKFCHYETEKKITADNSSGYNTDPHTGFLWEFENRDPPPPARTFDPEIYYFKEVRHIDSVYLTVRNFMNCVDKDTALIMIDKYRIDYFNTIPKDTIICSGDTIQFSANFNSLFPITEYKWNFGDDSTSNVKDPKHSYKFTYPHSNYYYSIKVTNEIGCDTTEYEEQPIRRLGLTLDIDGNNICIDKNDPSSLIAKTIVPTEITWLLPNDSTKIADSIKYKFFTEGTYKFDTYAEYIANDNCKDTLSSNIAVWLKPDLHINSDKDAVATLCDPISLVLNYTDSNNSTLLNHTKKWIVTNSSGTRNFQKNDIAIPLEKGSNVITFFAENPYCKDTAEREFQVFSPSGEMAIDNNDICKGDIITFTVKNLVDVTEFKIDFGDGSFDTISPAPHQYNFVPIGGTTIAKGIFSVNDGACIGPPVEQEIRIHEVFAKFGIHYNSDTPICFKDIHIKDSSSGADFYYWDLGDGTIQNVKEPQYHTYPSPGTYPIHLAIENTQFGCKDSFSDTLILLDKPIARAKSDTICFGESVKLYQIDKVDTILYYWKPEIEFPNNPSDTNTITPSETFKYSLIAIDTTSYCSDTADGLVHVVQPITPIHFDTILAPGANMELPFVLVENYSSIWNFDSFLSCIDCDYPTAEYILNPIKYIVVYRDLLKNCFTDTSTFNLRVYPDILVNAPTAFTPNGDGNNDVFYARGFGIKKLISFKIYNRWGQLLFFSQDENNGWDGYYKGTLQNSEMYYYTIEGESYIPDKIVTKEGNFMLLR